MKKMLYYTSSDLFTNQNLAAITEAVDAFLSVDSWDALKRLVEVKGDLLLTDTADLVFPFLLSQWRDDANTTRHIKERRELLARCRTEGTLATFAGENYDQAIFHYHQSLLVYSQETHPEKWAQNQNALGRAYLKRIRGERAENIERAISYHRQAFSVYTREATPFDWARTHYQLAIAYSQRIKGKPTDNEKLVTHHFRQALEVLYTTPTFSLLSEDDGTPPSRRIDTIDTTLVEVLLEHDNPATMFTLMEQHPELLSDEFEALLLQEITNIDVLGNKDGEATASRLKKWHERLDLIQKMMQEMGPVGDKALVRLREMPSHLKALLPLFQKFITAPNWIASHAVVSEHPELLSNEAGAMFAQMIANTQLLFSNEIPIDVLQEHYDLLGRYRREGIDAVFADRVRSQQITDAVLAFMDMNWGEKKEFLLVRQDILLTDEADKVIAELLEQFKDNAGIVCSLEEHRTLLARCRAEGILAVFTNPWLFEVVRAFVRAKNWQESKHIVKTQHDLLLTDEADQVLADWLERFKDEANMVRRLQEYRTLLARCRAEGIDTVFTNLWLSQVVQTFVSAKTWEESKHIVKTQHHLLLTDEADQVLADWLERFKDEASTVRRLQKHRILLARCRAEEIDVAFANDLDSQQIPEETTVVADESLYQQACDAVLAFVKADTLKEKRRLVKAKHDLLLADVAEQFFFSLLAKSQDTDVIYLLEEHRALLADCRREGIDTAFANLVPFYQQVGKAVLEFITVNNLDDRVSLVIAKPELLLTKVADHFLANVIKYSKYDALGIRVLLGLSRSLLISRRSKEIDSAFADKPLLINLMTEINQLTHSSNMPSDIELCRTALALVERKAQPEMWAMLQEMLADSLRKEFAIKDAGEIEQAIYHYQRALEVYTRETFPKDWANIQNDLANAYWLRIKGKRPENIEQAIFHYQQSFLIYTRQAFPNHWADTHNFLGKVYLERVFGGRAKNYEQALEHCRQALSVYTRETYPEEWADTQNHLALAYLHRVHGERALNIEQAILHCNQALEIRTHQDFPSDWARSQNHLASAYLHRVRGKRADNYEKAIDHARQALQIYTRQAFPVEWARSQSNLAAVYTKRIHGERAENYEQAIEHSQRSLEVYTRQTTPYEWAMSQNNLSMAYLDRIYGERAGNIEQALEHCHQALRVYTRQDFPFEWARCQNILGILYLNRVRGERAESLEQAIKHIQHSLEIYTAQDFPLEWANSQNNLAFAYIYRIQGERADNFEQAITHLEQALLVYTRQAFPFEWARSQNSLALAFLQRMRGERSKNIEQAIHDLQQALLVYTRQDFPFEWAMSQDKLAHAYRERIQGERAENYKQAIFRYRQALEICTPENFPHQCAQTAFRLGELLYGENRFAEACEALTIAHQAVEAQRSQIQREMARRDLSKEHVWLYAHLISCCLRDANADYTAAFEIAIISKGRAFVDALASTRFNLESAGADDPQLAADLLEARSLRQQIDNVLNHFTDLSDYRHRAPEERLLRNLQQQERQLWEKLAYKYPALTATQSAPELSVSQAQTLAAQLGATLVEFVQHTEGWSAFVVNREAMHHIRLPELDRDEDNKEDDLIGRMIKWTLYIEHDSFHKDSTSYEYLDEWYKALITPIKPYLPPKGKVVLAPAGILHKIPLSIARNPDTSKYLCDEYSLTFTPSLAALRVTFEEARGGKLSRFSRLLAVAYPGKSNDQNKNKENYLHRAVPEAQKVAKLFSKATPLHEADAKPQEVIKLAKGQEVIHFCCHGTFDRELPEQSGLALSGGYLTVQQIITDLHLQETRLVTLSACETHQVDLNPSEEHVGLVQALMVAGTQAVVASLWQVEERATTVLFKKFYSAIVAGKSPAKALQLAMRYVRKRARRWNHPYYWGAFQLSGVGYDLP